MVGCFGLRDDPHLSHFPGDRLVEANPRVEIWELHRSGALVDGAITELWWGDHMGRRLAARTPDLLFGGTRVPVIWDEPMEGVGRPWFECPLCKRRCKHLYFRQLACRRCCRLDYSSRHLRRQIPGVGRVERLRRRLGDCDVRPFAPLPERQRAVLTPTMRSWWG